MYRAFLALGIGFLVAATVNADLRPPTTQKKVVVDYKITTDKEISDYTFYLVLYGTGKSSKTDGFKVTEVKFDPKTPIEISGAKRTPAEQLGYVVAIPKNSAQTFASEKELAEAVRKGKVEGMAKTFDLDSTEVANDPENRNAIVKEYKFARLDGKIIILAPKKIESTPSPKTGEKKDSPEGGETPNANADSPRGGLWIAGIAATLAAMLGGLWIVGRTRRKP